MAPPAILLVHGQPGSGRNWRPVVERLDRARAVLAPDRPGYGAAADPPGGFAANAAAMRALLDARGLDRALVAGHSWGAGVALALAALYPERVAGLVLVAPVSPTDRFGPLDRALAHRLAGPPLARGAFAAAGRALTSAWGTRRLARRLPELGADDAREAARGWRDPRTRRAFLVEQRALLAELPGFAPALERVAVPAAVVVGERDRITSPRGPRELARALPAARLHSVPGAGHLLPWQAPGALVSAIAETAARGANGPEMMSA